MPRSKSARPKPERLEAELEGRTISEFIVTSAQSAAKQVIHNCGVRKLTSKDREVFVKSLTGDPEPTEKLRKAVRGYKKSFR